ncbi:RAMP superfamily protein [bacterium]|nr:RAMP superfamily protein [bacterium]
MQTYTLKIELLSDTIFGRGDGVAGLIDREVEHDPHGFPYLRGRTLKGLLSEECDNLVGILPNSSQSDWQAIANQLFGTEGSGLGTDAAMHIGDACLPKDLREAVAFQIQQGEKPKLTQADVLSSLTTIRRQTALNPVSGVPDAKSLRSSRVILRKLEFTADLIFATDPTDKMLSLLAAGVKALRRIGSSRNRGLGHVRCTLPEQIEQNIDLFFAAMEQTK